MLINTLCLVSLQTFSVLKSPQVDIVDIQYFVRKQMKYILIEHFSDMYQHLCNFPDTLINNIFLLC